MGWQNWELRDRGSAKKAVNVRLTQTREPYLLALTVIWADTEVMSSHNQIPAGCCTWVTWHQNGSVGKFKGYGIHPSNKNVYSPCCQRNGGEFERSRHVSRNGEYRINFSTLTYLSPGTKSTSIDLSDKVTRFHIKNSTSLWHCWTSEWTTLYNLNPLDLTLRPPWRIQQSMCSWTNST